MELTLTKENINTVFEKLVVGNIKAGNFNKRCFGPSDIMRMHAMEEVVDFVIEETENAGYCSHTILGPILDKYEYDLSEPADKTLKKELDDDFNIDLSNYQEHLAFSQNVFESTVKAFAEGKVRTC